MQTHRYFVFALILAVIMLPAFTDPASELIGTWSRSFPEGQVWISFHYNARYEIRSESDGYLHSSQGEYWIEDSTLFFSTEEGVSQVNFEYLFDNLLLRKAGIELVFMREP